MIGHPRRLARVSGQGFLDGWYVETAARSTWPGCQDALEAMIGHVPADVIADIFHRNAAALFRHPLPAETLP